MKVIIRRKGQDLVQRGPVTDKTKEIEKKLRAEVYTWRRERTLGLVQMRQTIWA